MINPQRFSIQKSAIFLALPLLWWGGISLSEKNQGAAPQVSDYQFIPVAIHASVSADYGADAFSAAFAPVDPSIIMDALTDQSISTQAAIDIANGLDAASNAEDKTEKEDEEDSPVTTADPTATPPPSNNGNGNGQGNGSGGNGNVNGNGNGNVNGNGNGNGNVNGNGNDKEDKVTGKGH